MRPERAIARDAVARVACGARDLRRARRGSAALEFAIAGPVLLLLIFAVIENGLMLFAQSMLDNATRDASRQIMIGTVRTSGAFQSALCNDVGSFLDCNRLTFYVQSFATFPSQPTPASSTAPAASATFASGSGGQFVLVEVAYDRAYITPWLSSIAGDWLLFSTQAIQNEPFS